VKPDLTQALSHVLWIGGATDSGKTTAAQMLSERHSLQVYHYDRRDAAHHEELAKTIPVHQAFLAASLDERWIHPEPETLLQRTLRSFRDRFALVIDDLLALPRDRQIVAEGFGLLPELLAPLLSAPSQAIWLLPTEEFKQASMTRRGKPSFASQTSDPARAKANLLERDMLLTAYIKDQAARRRCIVVEVNGSRSADEITNLIEQHFAPHL
jgi:adenylate kinase family enzyme